MIPAVTHNLINYLQDVYIPFEKELVVYVFVTQLSKLPINIGNHQNISFHSKWLRHIASVHFVRNYLLTILLLLLLVLLLLLLLLLLLIIIISQSVIWVVYITFFPAIIYQNLSPD